MLLWLSVTGPQVVTEIGATLPDGAAAAHKPLLTASENDCLCCPVH